MDQRIPSESERDQTKPGVEATQSAAETDLARAVAPLLKQHPGLCGVHALTDPYDAFAARVLLIRTAARSLDIQYYIWHDDVTGNLMLNELYEAAERGVRVRLLLDDNGIAGLDSKLSWLMRHGNIEIRLFNPFVFRRPKWIGYLFDFPRMNRRMHNKSFTADNTISIVGGRNIGDEYFGAGAGHLFADLDVAMIGEIVQRITMDFDRYWQCQVARPAEEVLNRIRPSRNLQGENTPFGVTGSGLAEACRQAVHRSGLVRQLNKQNLSLIWAEVHLVSDDPEKVRRKLRKEKLITHQLREVIGRPQEELILVSPYFVPTRAGLQAFRTLVRKGVNVYVLTNSLAATDVTVVHAGYSKYRKKLLEAGVKLYELKPQGGLVKANLAGHPLGSSGTSLHAKTFSVDRRRIFVGSFNFDPRSAEINTESGVVIESGQMGQWTREEVFERVLQEAYEVRLRPAGGLQWIEHRNGDQRIHSREPEAGFFRKLVSRVVSKFPIDSYL